MPKIYIYAEVLTHLRQLTLHASLETAKNEETKIDISSDRKIITIFHDGESSSLYLPTQISGTAKVTFPLERKTEISARVQIDDLEQWKETDAAGVEAPWDASELSSDTAFKCVQCKSDIVSTGTITTWKDLPNQNWADIMDLWFCHKPHETADSKDEQRAAEAKGFSAQSRLLSESGVGFVDLVSFALHPDDCNNLKIGMFSSNDNLVRLEKSSLSVKAARAQSYISYPSTTFVAAQLLELIESTAIRKVIVYSQPPDPVEKSSELEPKTKATTTPEDKDLPSTAVSEENTETTAEDTAARKQIDPNAQLCLSTPTDDQRHSDLQSRSTSQIASEPQPLILWIFNPDIYYSSSSLNTSSPKSTPVSPAISPSTDIVPDSVPATSPEKEPSTTASLLPHRALKVFYQPLPPTTPLSDYLSSTSPLSQSHEPLPLPIHTLTSLHAELQTSTSLLPSTARTFNTEWQVGLLDRYERHSTAEKVMAMNPLARKLVAGAGGRGMDGRPRVTRWELPEGAAGLFE